MSLPECPLILVSKKMKILIVALKFYHLNSSIFLTKRPILVGKHINAKCNFKPLVHVAVFLARLQLTLLQAQTLHCCHQTGKQGVSQK